MERAKRAAGSSPYPGVGLREGVDFLKIYAIIVIILKVITIGGSMEEKKMCEYCGKVEADPGYPVCHHCFVITMQWGTPAQKQRMKYYLQKEQMEKDPVLKEQVMSARRKAVRKYYEENKEKIFEYNKKYRAENYEKIKQRNRIYQQEHKEQSKEYQKKYISTHREQWNAYQREYKKRKAAEASALRERVAQLEAQLDKLQQAR